MPVLQKLLPLALPTLVLHRWHGLPYTEYLVVHRPHRFLPTTSDLQTGKTDEQIKHRDTYWHGALVLEVILGMAVAEICRLAITASRHLIHHCRPDHGYSQLPSEIGAASADTTSQPQQQGGTPEDRAVLDTSVMGDRAAVAFHVAYQCFCASVALGAYKTDSLSLSSGLDFEWWGLFVLMNMLDGVLQSVLRSLTMPIQELDKSWTQFVAPKLALFVVPGMSDRVDIQVDWAFIAIVLRRVSEETDEQLRQVVVMIIGVAAALVLVLSYSKIYVEPPLRSELRSDFFTVLEPSEKDAVGIMDVARDCTNPDKWGTFALQSMAKLASPAKQAIAKFEDVPQAVLKLIFIVLISGPPKAGPFLWFTALLSLAKAALLPVLWRRLLRGLPLRVLLRKLSSTEDKQESEQLLREPEDRAKAEAATVAEFAAALAKLSAGEQTRIYAVATVLSGADLQSQVLSEVLLQALALVILPPAADREESQTQGLLEAAAAQRTASPLRFPLLFVLLQSPTPALRTAAEEELREAAGLFGLLSLARTMKQWLDSVNRDEMEVETLDKCTSLLQQLLKDGDSAQARAHACVMLGSLATVPAAAASPELLKEWSTMLQPLVRDSKEEVRCAACNALGQTSFAALQALLGDGDSLVRAAACSALGQMVSDPSASPELPKESFAALQPVLTDVDHRVRYAACNALGEMAIAPSASPELRKESFTALQPLLGDGDLHVRAAACFALASDPSASPELLKESFAGIQSLAGEENAEVRATVCYALGEMASAPSASPELQKESLAALQPLLGDGDLHVRAAACSALGQMASAPSASTELRKESLAALQPLLGDGHWRVRSAACSALGQMASAPSASTELQKESLAALQPLLGDGDLHVRGAACSALGQMASAPSASPELMKESLAALQPLLGYGDWRVRSAACSALGEMASAPSASPELRKESLAALQPPLGDGDPDVRKAAAKALEGLKAAG